jgi:very-short-patch-repair endonuclease
VTKDPRLFARHLRRNATSAEDTLWQVLRGRRFRGLKFKRQAPLLAYAVDFLCFERKLVVEVDGVQHEWFDAYDAARTREIEAHGFTVLRATNYEVLNELDVVLGRLADALDRVSMACDADARPKA